MKMINDIIQDAKTVGISGHVRPDGDCIGSCMALYNYIKKNRSDVQVKVYLEFVDNKFKIIENADMIDTNGYDGTVFDLFIALDTASSERLGKNHPFFENAKRTACIDHHASNKGYADYNYIVPDASSACEVLYSILDEDALDISVAQPLYLGIAHDSGVFRFQSTSPDTLRIAAKLMEMGVDFNGILEDTYYGKTFDQMMITAKIQSNCVIYLDGKCICGYCTADMMKEYNVQVNDLDAVVASIRNVEGTEVAVFMYELKKDLYKISLRSKKKVDVSKIAVEFGGGGHIRAAGFEVHGTLNEVMEKVINRLSQEEF